MKPLYNGMVSPVLVRRLKDLWPDGLHVVTEWGATYPDDDVWAQARRLGLVIFTKDHDFGDSVRYPGPLAAGQSPVRDVYGEERCILHA